MEQITIMFPDYIDSWQFHITFMDNCGNVIRSDIADTLDECLDLIKENK